MIIALYIFKIKFNIYIFFTFLNKFNLKKYKLSFKIKFIIKLLPYKMESCP